MTIHRVGPLPDAAPTRRELGRVLVTIDDLAALMDILRQDAADPSRIQVQFSGGYFTQAEDLRFLSDDEIRSLKVVSDALEVNLEPTRAVAAGGDAAAAKVSNTWARTRQTNRNLRGRAASSFLGVASGIALAIFALFSLGLRDALNLNAPLIVLVLLASACVASWTTLRDLRKFQGAVIIPMTRSEFRALHNSNQWPRVAGIAAVVGVIVAVVAVLVTLLVTS